MAALVLLAAGVLLLVPWSAARLRSVGRAGAGSVGAGTVAALLCPVPAVVVVAAVFGGAIPAWWQRRRVAAAALRSRSAWPDAIDTIRAAVRAGATVAEATAAPGRRARPLGSQPTGLEARFARYRRRLAAGELFDSAVAALHLPDDPIADRVIAVLRLAASAGSADVGRVLAALSAFVRADLAQQREIAARQQWNVAAARVAAAAPWLTVMLLAVQPTAREVYASAAGAVLLAVVAVVSVGAYWLMTRAARVVS